MSDSYRMLLIYFWQERGDLERYAGFDRERMAVEYPDILKAWDDYKASRAALSALVRDLERED